MLNKIQPTWNSIFYLWILETPFHSLILSVQHLLTIFPLVTASSREKKDEKEVKSRTNGFAPSEQCFWKG